MNRKIIYVLILAGLIIGGAVGFNMYNKPLDKTEDIVSVASLSAESLLKMFEEDEDMANSKYLGKVVEVKGKVMKNETSDGVQSVYLDAQNDFSAIICQMDENSTQAISVGDEILIKGVCSGFLMDVILVRAVVL